MLIDTHAHLDMDDFDHDREAVIDRAIEGGVSRIITIGIDQESSQKAVALAESYSFIYASVGFHPHDADAFDAEAMDALVRLSSYDKVVAWGEIGLDFFRLRSSKEKQMTVFRRQLEMAHELNLPVIIHDRDAHEAVLEILSSFGRGNNRGVIHCYSGDQDLAEAFINLGYYISIPGTVTFKKADNIKSVAADIPLDRLLLETDAPFLSPVPKRGKRNEPLYVTHTAQAIARLKKMPLADLARMTTENAMNLFGFG